MVTLSRFVEMKLANVKKADYICNHHVLFILTVRHCMHDNMTGAEPPKSLVLESPLVLYKTDMNWKNRQWTEN